MRPAQYPQPTNGCFVSRGGRERVFAQVSASSLRKHAVPIGTVRLSVRPFGWAPIVYSDDERCYRFGAMRMAPRYLTELTRLDVEVVRFCVRFPGCRPEAITAWCGASHDGIRKSLRRLMAHKMVRQRVLQLDLVGADRSIRETTARVWLATGRGARLAGTWRVPGSGMQVSLDAGSVSHWLGNHQAGVASLAAWYRHGVVSPDGVRRGFEVGGEREVLSLERRATSAVDSSRPSSQATGRSASLGARACTPRT